MNHKTATGLHFLLLALITVFSLTVRIYQAGNFPPLLWDEASLGYNAYSILKTGKDEYGRFLPLIFKSFGDYKPGLYIYLTLPFVAALGLNPLAVRLPSIILGSLTPLLVYLLIRRLSPKSSRLALIAALLLAFNPYNIHFSRGAWETNILTFELVVAAFFFVSFFQTKKTYFLPLSALVFGTTLYTYQAGKMISLLLIAVLGLLYLKPIIGSRQSIFKFFLAFILPLAVFTLPLAAGLLFGSDSNRLKVISLWSYPRHPAESQTIIAESSQTDYNLFHNHFLFYLRNAAFRYFNHFSARFLVFEGDWQSPRHSAPYAGVLLYPSLIFLVIGLLASFLSSKSLSKQNFFFLGWLLLAPIPAALTRDSVQAVRTMSFSVPLVYFSAYGLNYLIDRLKAVKQSGFVLPLFGFMVTVAYLLSFVYYADLYLNHLTKKSPNDTLYGYSQAMQYLVANQDRYDNLIFTDFYGQPYIYYLFYSQYPPTRYQVQANLTESAVGDTGKIEKIDRLRFGTPDFNVISQTPNTLAIFSHDEILRQGINTKPEFSQFIPLSPINGLSTFYAYQN